MKNLISFIIPCFNSENTIDRTISSIIASFTCEYEIIVIDDASTDGTLKKIQSNKSIDKVIINDNNSGVSISRNRGIDQATGNYIMFIDSDDNYIPDNIDSLTNLLEMNKFDVIAFNYINNDNIVNIIPDFATSKESILNYFLSKENKLGAIWPFAFKTDFIKNNHIKFKKHIIIAEDYLFSFTALFRSKSFIYNDNVIYHYNYTENSATHSKLTLKKIKDFYEIDKDIILTLTNSNYSHLISFVLSSKADRSLDQWRTVLININDYTKDEFLEIRKEISKQIDFKYTKNFKNIITYLAVKSNLISSFIIKLKGEK